MKIIFEKHPELDRLSYCFEKIERVAEHFGVPVDELEIDQELNSTHEHEQNNMYVRRKYVLQANMPCSPAKYKPSLQVHK